MNNPYIEHLNDYKSLMEAFVDTQISSKEFNERYTVLWEQDRNTEHLLAIDSTTGRNIHTDIIARYNNEIISEEYDMAYYSLFKLTPILSQIHHVIDNCCVDCYALRIDEEVPLDPPFVIDGMTLLEFVREHLAELKKLIDEANLNV